MMGEFRSPQQLWRADDMKTVLKRIFNVLVVLAFVLPWSGLAANPAQAAGRPEVISCADVTEIPQIECEALVALYNSTDGPNWYHHTKWLVTLTPSNWYGVTVGGGYVTSLELGWNNLVGSIPSETGNLASLYWLDLDANQLFGSIPPEIWDLTSLGYLDLG
jgi:hypothetical protein